MTDEYYDDDTNACKECPDAGSVVGVIFAVLAALGVVVALAALLYKLARMRSVASTRRHARFLLGLIVTASPVAKLKIVFSFVQIVLMLPTTYRVKVPPEWYDWVRFIQWINFDLFEVIPQSCIEDFEGRLFLRTFLALMLVLIGPLIGMCWECARALHAGLAVKDACVRGTIKGVPVAVLIAFVLTPVVSKGLFSTFDCKQYAIDDTAGSYGRFLVEDLSIRCSTSDYTNSKWDSVVGMTIAFIFVWPVGMPLLFFGLLFLCRQYIQMQRWTPMTKASLFLHRECTLVALKPYAPRCMNFAPDFTSPLLQTARTSSTLRLLSLSAALPSRALWCSSIRASSSCASSSQHSSQLRTSVSSKSFSHTSALTTTRWPWPPKWLCCAASPSQSLPRSLPISRARSSVSMVRPKSWGSTIRSPSAPSYLPSWS